MPRHINDRIHESLAIAALLAGGVALNVAWIDNLLITRSDVIASWITINPAIGPISGLYVDTLGAFFVTYLFAAAIWRGKDVSHWRGQVFWFFFASVVAFIILTLPFVFGFVVS
jgi:hypothetical protein